MTDKTTTPPVPVTGDKREGPTVALRFDAGDVLRVERLGDYGRIKAGAGNAQVSLGLVKQAAVLGSHGQRIDPEASSFALGFVDSMAPRDAAETLLLAQMAVIHQATMMMARRLNHVENLRQQDAAERALNKLARTYAAQLDGLKRYRSKGQQVVRVERVNVESGGQAVVGNVQHGGRADGQR
ncbi:hypothetical protein E4191_08080 [Paracoccus liaowanqingii]|uniref:Uncharacterized protein n=1 Tax=Paracoccus liaowanqingii TaxID=2560053 RepID=A0A4P7HNB4_9RHOB|nr:hypothetical protein [Paracoccus liaowanqingii]QBX34671.1 hypothetical protein E4191_08080 [Paracoccus liaowanqingii]